MISMKNNKIITSWDKIEPSDSANDRMLSAILEKNRSVHDRKDKVNYMSQRKNFKKFLIPVAACLVAIVAVTGIVGSNMGWFGSKGYTVNLANGDSIVYHIGSTNVASIHVGYPVSSRKLTDAELDAILPETTERRSAIGTFREENGELLRVEGKLGDATIIFAQVIFPISDVVLEGNESSSSVNGIPVTTGYFVTSPNSRGEQSAIFFASFSIGNTNVYVECYGDKSDADAVSQETADLIFSIITKGEPDFSAITK